MGCMHGGQMLLVVQAWRSGVWVASMEVRCDGLQAWRSGVIGCKHGG